MNDNFINVELKLNRSSGTYLFYGEDRTKNFSEALAFIKKLFTRNETDLEKRKNLEARIDNRSHTDFFVFDIPAIDDVREIKSISYSSSNENGIKVFLIKDIKNIRREAANALLKVIEEPTANNFFVLLAPDLEILATIKSRSILYKIKKDSPEDLAVDKYIYDFFLGSSEDIKNYKEENLSLSYEVTYTNIANIIKNYEDEANTKHKIRLYLAIRDFIGESSNLNTFERISFAENIYSAYKDKETLDLIIKYSLNLIKNHKNLKEKLLMKKMLRFPVNYKVFLINFFIDL